MMTLIINAQLVNLIEFLNNCTYMFKGNVWVLLSYVLWLHVSSKCTKYFDGMCWTLNYTYYFLPPLGQTMRPRCIMVVMKVR